MNKKSAKSLGCKTYDGISCPVCDGNTRKTYDGECVSCSPASVKAHTKARRKERTVEKRELKDRFEFWSVA